MPLLHPSLISKPSHLPTIKTHTPPCCQNPHTSLLSKPTHLPAIKTHTSLLSKPTHLPAIKPHTPPCCQTPHPSLLSKPTHLPAIKPHTPPCCQTPCCCSFAGLEENPDRPHHKLPYRGAWLWIGPEMIHLMELPDPDPKDNRPEVCSMCL